MEEDKAAAYYEDLARKGGAAARFKQGLGFSSQSVQDPPSKHNAQFSLSNFVKAAGPGMSEALGKETQIENIREKLKKKGESALEQQKGRDVAKSLRTGKEERQDASRERDRSKSRSPKRLKEKSHERDGKHSRHRDYRSRSPYGKDRRHRSRSTGRDSKQSSRRDRRSYSRSMRTRSTSSDRSRDHRHHKTVRCRSSSRSSSRSYDNDFTRKKRREQSSSYGSEEESQSPLSYSHRRHKGRSRSPATRSKSSKQRKGTLNRSRTPGQQRRREENHLHRSRKVEESNHMGRQNGKEAILKNMTSSHKEKAPVADYSKLIDGYDSMTPAEKVKAKIKLQLSETAVKDASKGTTSEWERFDFNKDAPLDDDAKLDSFGDDIEAKDDTQFLRNTGTTFSASAAQAKRELDIQAAHEAAIFGTHIQTSNNSSYLYPDKENENALEDNQNEDNILSMTKGDTVEDMGSKGNVLGNSLISEQVYSMQQGSWRERARKMREQKTNQTRN